MKILVAKTINGFLKPAYDSDHEQFGKMPLNEVFEIEYKKVRNPKFHRKFFALLKLCFENQDSYRNLEDLRHDVTIEAGFYTEVVNVITGEIRKKPNSISFSTMDDTEFAEVYTAVRDVIVKFLAIECETLEEELQQYF